MDSHDRDGVTIGEEQQVFHYKVYLVGESYKSLACRHPFSVLYCMDVIGWMLRSVEKAIPPRSL